MTVSYRTRTRARRFFTVVSILLAVILAVWLLWLLWLGRFVVYQRGYGAKLNFSLSAEFPAGSAPAQKPTKHPWPIVYQDQVSQTPTEQTGIAGYYIDFNMLKQNLSTVQAQLEELPAGTAVLVDVKNPKGLFHYSTAVGDKVSGEVDTAQFDALIEYLTDRNLHVIARLPAFRDRHYGLNNIPSGISYEGGGGALWIDNGGCYWLDPTKDKPLSYLISITKELRNLGFDEVVFTDFCLPNDKTIIFKGDKQQAIADAAATLVDACATETFWVSFTGDAAFPLPQGNSRLYMENVPAAEVQNLIEQITTDDPTVHVLFYANSNDTRYNDYCVLRPLETAQ